MRITIKKLTAILFILCLASCSKSPLRFFGSEKSFFISGKKELEHKRNEKFYPDTKESRNFTITRAGYRVHYNPSGQVNLNMEYKNQNPIISYEFNLIKAQKFDKRIYQTARLDNPQDQNTPLKYESISEPSEQSINISYAPLKGVEIGKTYKLIFEAYADEARTILIERVVQEIKSPIDNTKECIKFIPDLMGEVTDSHQWACPTLNKAKS